MFFHSSIPRSFKILNSTIIQCMVLEVCETLIFDFFNIACIQEPAQGWVMGWTKRVNLANFSLKTVRTRLIFQLLSTISPTFSHSLLIGQFKGSDMLFTQLLCKVAWIRVTRNLKINIKKFSSKQSWKSIFSDEIDWSSLKLFKFFCLNGLTVQLCFD